MSKSLTSSLYIQLCNKLTLLGVTMLKIDVKRHGHIDMAVIIEGVLLSFSLSVYNNLSDSKSYITLRCPSFTIDDTTKSRYTSIVLESGLTTSGNSYSIKASDFSRENIEELANVIYNHIVTVRRMIIEKIHNLSGLQLSVKLIEINNLLNK